MAKLPPDHKAKWFAGAALNSSDQAMASVMSTVLSRLNAFLDSEMEQILCFDMEAVQAGSVFPRRRGSPQA
jgi:type IV secretion system protein VirD4